MIQTGYVTCTLYSQDNFEISLTVKNLTIYQATEVLDVYLS